MVSKLQKPVLQHFVPKVYLRYFESPSAKGNVWVLHVDSDHSHRPYLKGVKAVCSRQDCYTIKETEKSRFGITHHDAYIIEKEAFPYESGELRKLWTQLMVGKPPLPGERFSIAQLLLDLKRRTDRFQRRYTDPQLIRYVSRGVLNKFLRREAIVLDYTLPDGRRWGDVVADVIVQAETEFLNPDYPRGAYLSGFIPSNQDERLDRKLIKMIGWSNFFVIKAGKRKFITSDNPGFTMLQDGALDDINFKEWHSYFHVLSPDSLLVVSPFPLREMPFLGC